MTTEKPIPNCDLHQQMIIINLKLRERQPNRQQAGGKTADSRKKAAKPEETPSEPISSPETKKQPKEQAERMEGDCSREEKSTDEHVARITRK